MQKRKPGRHDHEVPAISYSARGSTGGIWLRYEYDGPGIELEVDPTGQKRFFQNLPLSSKSTPLSPLCG